MKLTPEKHSHQIITIAEHYGIEPQTDMLIEEMAELTKALLKHRRAKVAGKATGKLLSEMADEMADVKIMLEQIEYLCNRFVDDEFSWFINARMNEKLERQIKRIAAETMPETTPATKYNDRYISVGGAL